MAVTITRSIWIDDDGTGTTGTVINQALHTTLYNEIDTALAKVAQLAGGNTFTGNQAITGGSLTVAGTGPHTFSTGGVERMRIGSAGNILINTTTIVNGEQLGLTFNAVNGYGMLITNLYASNAGSFIAFNNSANVLAGNISQNGATGVLYNTTSDARLKDDAGRATDVRALRAVVVHEFTWKADGTRARGIFAQEAYDVFPHAVTPGTDETTDDGSLARPWMTDYSKFVPDLIVGWQQHEADLQTLRAALDRVVNGGAG